MALARVLLGVRVPAVLLSKPAADDAGPGEGPGRSVAGLGEAEARSAWALESALDRGGLMRRGHELEQHWDDEPLVPIAGLEGWSAFLSEGLHRVGRGLGGRTHKEEEWGRGGGWRGLRRVKEWQVDLWQEH